MTFEERIDKLTERHEALAQTVELMGHEVRDLISATKENAANIDKLTENIAKLVEVSNRDSVDILKPAHIA